MADALRVHDAIVRGTIERHGGYVFAHRRRRLLRRVLDRRRRGGGGDRVAGAAARRHAPSTSRFGWGCTPARRSNATGTTSAREVNRAARLMSLAHGGQVLVSDATEVLLRNRVALRPLGEHRLRGLRGRMSVYQVVADGLPTEFPVLRSVDYFAGNLPQQLSSLVGREDGGRRGRRARAVEPAGHAERRRRGRQDPAGPRGRGRGGGRVPRRRVDGRAGVGRRPGARSRRPIATVLGITPQGDAPLDRHGRRGARPAGSCCWWSTTASTSWPRRASAIAAILGRSGNVEDPRHVARDARGRRRDGVSPCAPLALDGGVTSDAVTLFVDRARAVRPDFGLQEPRDGRRGDRDLRDPRRAPARDRAGRGAHGRDERGRGPGSTRRSVPAVAGVDAGPGAPAHAPPRGRVVLRPADRRRARRCSRTHVGVRRRLRPDEHLRGGRRRRRRRRAPAPRLARPQVARRRRPHRHPHPLQPLRDHPPVRRGPAWRRPARSSGRAIGTPRTSRARRPRDGSTGTGPGGATRSTGWRPSSATCVPGTSGARRAASWRWRPTSPRTPRSWASRCSCSRRSPGPRSCSSAAAAADVRRLPRLYTAAGYACFAGRAEAARANAHRATELEVDDRYDACEPGYAIVHRGARQVYCGDLDRYIELTGEVARAVRKRSGLRPRRPTSTASSRRPDRRGARAHRGVRRRGAIARQPLLDLVRALDRGHGVLEGRRAPGVRGVGRGRRLRARAPRPVLRRLPRTRRGAPAHLRRRARGGAGAVRRRHRGVPAGRQRARS